MPAPTFVVAVPLLAILAVATWSDLRDRRIPNGLSLGGAALGLLINAVTFGSSGLALAAVGWALCLACFIPLYVAGGTAGGDVKLIAMAGAFLGPMDGFAACMFTLVAGAALAAACLAWRDFVAPRLSAQPCLEPAGGHALDKIPYAAAIAVGSAAAVLQPPWLTALLPLGVTP
jgi:prepilin peptidase CpaA